MNILITDTGSGLGHSLALEFLRNGASVYGISSKFNGKLKRYKHYYHLTHDLKIHKGLSYKLKNFLSNTQTVDIAILNAGFLAGINDIRKTSLEEIIRLMNVNLLANKVIIDTLLESVSSVYQIVAISSRAAIDGSKGLNAFAISKAALNTLIKLYAQEIPETHFSALEPGINDADLHESYDKKSNYKISDHKYAANCMVEAMGIILQEKSGVYSDVRDILLVPELVS